MTPFAEAWEKFMTEHPDTFNPETLGIKKDLEQFLHNRLHHAFSDGWNAGTGAENDHLGKVVMEKLKSL